MSVGNRYFCKESEKAIGSLIKKHQMITKTDTIIRVCDESLLARDEYQQLATVKISLTCEYLIANHRIEITNLINEDIKIGTFNIDKNENLSNNLEEFDNDIIVNKKEIGNDAYKSIYTMLQTLIPI
ncbi:8629_t:CDS:2 [Funneliformis mosseae]|uniref:8629_t:CDS:1 n=1 Tax=Funneliformis mosseae TaxID=27381 RepID=A0A9N8VKJ8_FUNMO|nr:8629_t:CDS:2 [Funneliformis mosseae]